MDELPGENDLSLEFPCWLLASRDTVEIPEVPGAGVILTGASRLKGVEAGAEKVLAVFTDEDLAERLLRYKGDDNAIVVGVPDEQAFAQVLRLARAQGFTLLGGDMSGVEGENIKWRSRIDDILERLESDDA